jgi:hypothetical protein
MQNNRNIATRSSTKLKELKVDIDFDDAATEWNKNKKLIGNGHYKYICTITTNKNPDTKIQYNKVCNKACYKNNDKCWIHRNK